MSGKESELRAWLARQLKVEDVHEALWKYLKENDEEVFERALPPGAEEREDLLWIARRQRKLFKEMGGVVSPGSWKAGQGRRTATEVEPIGTDAHEEERSRAFSEHLALIAGVDEDVLLFRHGVLGDRLLEAEQAHQLASSPAAARYPLGWFEEEKVPVVGHGCTVEEERWDLDDYGLHVTKTFTVDPPGANGKTKEYKDVSARPGAQRGGGGSAVEDDYERPYGEWKPYALRFPYRELGGLYSSIPVSAGSVLDELRELSEGLSEGLCYPWKPEEAAWFVLTDEAPTLKPLDIRFVDVGNPLLRHGTITLSVEPWVSAETVYRAYLDVQNQVLGHRNRPLSPRNVAVFGFVTERLRSRINKQLWREEDPGADSWRRRLQDWNALHLKKDEWRYKGDGAVRTFLRDFKHRALPEIVHPRYHRPQGRKG
ncbi:MAG: hypothetical protein M3P49_00130 [Actinomycetota bacterium]|nr:hypothetical protein [Actinomycetota bacterium]